MNKSDSKYFKTAVKFDEALLRLLEKKPFEYITVSEISKEAGVNRSTFYLHYENTSDLLEETSRYIIDKFVSYFSSEEQSFILWRDNCDITELNFINSKYLNPYLSFIKENRKLFATVIEQPVTFKSDRVFEDLFKNIFNPILERFSYPENERRYVMMFYLKGLTALITEWLRDDCDKSVGEMTEIIRYCIFGRSDQWADFNS